MLGAILGVAGSAVYFLSLGWGKPIKLGEPLWALFAFFFISLATAALGLLVAGVVDVFESVVPESSSRSRRALSTGAVAMMASSIATFAFFAVLPLVLHADRWATAAVTGILGGAAFGALFFWRSDPRGLTAETAPE
ncbi:hypothetical protein IG195_08840 [Arthrobacter sp. TES]|uniref:hypothetical protein n=1 Tax=Paenarthrobacter TaxID=1742992 RepID=UPI000397B54D|nr:MULTISPECIES: hypothetical protein [Paenarthrobacter]ERI35558.1 hypothetical protein M707_21075 [Arthrobacter sp. AK-YN10]KUR62896.1 hypothetical protein JM67_19990 [Arthrobacter sp. ATCC 21022]QOI65119.1 hypothetical protein IG195_08840 [Arthrobacter sp. TES]QSZ52334.1 hypothetical protein AYX19_04510 [Paenarthrobacter ureafaciens]WOC60908.1 hypothetical protein RI444_20825 [Paenarthrobacter sp. AT5]